MGHSAQTLIGDAITGLAADAVGLVLDAAQGCLEIVDELQQTLSHATCFSLGEGSSAVMDCLKGGLCVGYVIALIVDGTLTQEIVIADSLLELLHDKLTELLELLVCVGSLLVTHCIVI